MEDLIKFFLIKQVFILHIKNKAMLKPRKTNLEIDPNEIKNVNEKFTVIKPKDPKLKKLIHAFYFHQNDTPNEIKRIVFFPNTNNALTIYKNAELITVSEDPKHFRILDSNENDFLLLYGGIQETAIISEIHAPFDKIGIVFKPLGMNHFINDRCIGRHLKKEFNFYPIEQKLKPYLKYVYATDDLDQRVEKLEGFFLDNICHSFSEPKIKKAIQMIESFDGKIKISELADTLSMHKKTLLRKFKYHLNCTPKHYCKVYQFRNALNMYHKHKQRKSLTDLAYSCHYYDQSDFIKNFKALAGKNPSFFFNQVDTFSDEIYWFN